MCVSGEEMQYEDAKCPKIKGSSHCNPGLVELLRRDDCQLRKSLVAFHDDRTPHPSKSNTSVESILLFQNLRVRPLEGGDGLPCFLVLLGPGHRHLQYAQHRSFKFSDDGEACEPIRCSVNFFWRVNGCSMTTREILFE